jgi:hypothetical protein
MSGRSYRAGFQKAGAALTDLRQTAAALRTVAIAAVAAVVAAAAYAAVAIAGYLDGVSTCQYPVAAAVAAAGDPVLLLTVSTD